MTEVKAEVIRFSPCRLRVGRAIIFSKLLCGYFCVRTFLCGVAYEYDIVRRVQRLAEKITSRHRLMRISVPMKFASLTRTEKCSE